MQWLTLHVGIDGKLLIEDEACLGRLGIFF